MTDVNIKGIVRGLSALAILAVAGCGGSADGPGTSPEAGGGPAKSGAAAKPRLVFVTNSNSDWWTAVEKGMQDAAKEYGATVEMKRNEGEAAGQIRLLEDVLSQSDVQGVAVSVLEADSPGIADAMRKLKDSGKKVIAIDSDGKPDARLAYIGTNNKKAGEVAGKVAAQVRPQGGKTGVFVGLGGAANAIERREGFFAGAGPKFEQLEVFEDQGDKVRAASNVQTALSKYPELGVLLGLWSYNAPKIAEEVARSPEIRKKVSIITFDLDEQAIDHIENGRIDASVCQNPYDIGYLGVKLLKAYIVNDGVTLKAMLPNGTTEIETGVRVIVPSKESPVKGDNVIDIKAMKEWLKSKGLTSS
jgi:ribose transport system substrate-binding protein